MSGRWSSIACNREPRPTSRSRCVSAPCKRAHRGEPIIQVPQPYHGCREVCITALGEKPSPTGQSLILLIGAPLPCWCLAKSQRANSRKRGCGHVEMLMMLLSDLAQERICDMVQELCCSRPLRPGLKSANMHTRIREFMLTYLHTYICTCIIWAALCSLHPPSCESNDKNESGAEASCMLVGDPHIPQKIAPTVRARKTAQTYKSHDCTMWHVKGFYSPKSEQLHVPPCLRRRVQRCHKRHAVSSSSQLPVECENCFMLERIPNTCACGTQPCPDL